MAARDKVPANSVADAEFDQAFGLLEQLVDLSQANQLAPLRSNAVYLTSVVLWMLVYQRMNPDSSLEAAVKLLIESRPGLLPDNQRVTGETLSTNTGAYSRARSRLPLEAARWLAEQVSQSLIDASPPTFDGRRVFLFDGTTITLAPEEELQRQYPPASNQHGAGVWPVALLVVAHELASGAALVPAVGAMYGPQAVSETALMRGCLDQLPPDGIVMADAGYGIFAVAWNVDQTGRPFVLRLSPQRFRALQKKSTPVESGPGGTTSSLVWRPSPKEQKNHPDLPRDAEIQVRLHEISVGDSGTLFLVTSLPQAASSLAELYRCRGDVEIDIRNLKVVLKTEEIRARSTAMFQKELLTSMVAYNLVTQFRRQAAELVNKPPRRLSFKRTWTTFRQFLWSKPMTDSVSWRERYGRALSYAMQDTLPDRLGRSYPREVYHRRPKSSQFPKRRRPTNGKPDL
jgi:hypothetical protein